ncbi:MAG: nucleoside deaminase [Lachnospiraceae bacterium]|nr:nucleoside deaminase [Lachnospiraceae bacterium]
MDYMREALKEAYEGINAHHGGPFGSVIVKDGRIIGRGHNSVLLKKDPTCHGEMEAIRDACKNEGTHDLTGCELYTTAEPCPMCLGAILWANISKVYYGCNVSDTDKIGFRDDKFYDFFNGKKSILSLEESNRKECQKLFEDYNNDKEAKRY